MTLCIAEGFSASWEMPYVTDEEYLEEMREIEEAEGCYSAQIANGQMIAAVDEGV